MLLLFRIINNLTYFPFYRLITDKEGDRIHIKVDSDLVAFLANGNGKIIVTSPPIRTEADFRLEQEYAEYEDENRFY